MKTQLRFITDAVEHTNRGETVGQVEARRLISDVGDLASAVIAQLADGIDRSQEVLQENDTLLRRATEMSCPSKSAYDLAASERSIVLLHNEVESLLQYPADPFLFTGMQNYRCVNRGGSGIVIVIIIITSTFEQWRRNEFESGREAPASGAKRRKMFLWSFPSTVLALKVQLVVTVGAFVVVNTVWSDSCLLFFYSMVPRAQPFAKVGTCAPRAKCAPRARWSGRH